MIGFDKRTKTAGDGLPTTGLVIPSASGVTSGWVTLHTWSRDEAIALRLLGPAYLYGHVGADLGDPVVAGPVAETFPTSIKTQWLRASADGLTARTQHAIGSEIKWADGRRHPETLSLDDFPIRFQVWQKGGLMVVRKATALIDAYDARMAYRHEPSQVTELWNELLA